MKLSPCWGSLTSASAARETSGRERKAEDCDRSDGWDTRVTLAGPGAPGPNIETPVALGGVNRCSAVE
jgi:hypothetical protein